MSYYFYLSYINPYLSPAEIAVNDYIDEMYNFNQSYEEENFWYMQYFDD